MVRTPMTSFLVLSFGVAPIGCSNVECRWPYAEEGHQCVLRDEWSLACPTSDREDLSHTGVLYAGRFDQPGFWSLDGPLIDSQEEYEAIPPFFEGTDALPPVDFDTHVVLAASVRVPATCGSQMREHGLFGDTTLVVRIEDHFGICEAVCDAPREFLVLYAIARPAEGASVCTEIIGTCE